MSTSCSAPGGKPDRRSIHDPAFRLETQTLRSPLLNSGVSAFPADACTNLYTLRELQFAGSFFPDGTTPALPVNAVLSPLPTLDRLIVSSFRTWLFFRFFQNEGWGSGYSEVRFYFILVSCAFFNMASPLNIVFNSLDNTTSCDYTL